MLAPRLGEKVAKLARRPADLATLRATSAVSEVEATDWLDDFPEHPPNRPAKAGV